MTSRAEVQRLRHTFAAFSRVVRAYRLYNSDNTTVRRMLDDVWRQFTDLLEVTGSVLVQVQPEALLVGEDTVLEATGQEESIAFALYRDGLRRIEFVQGLPVEELESLVEAISYGLHFAGVGDDIVSLLWRRDLSFLNYVVIDTTLIDSQGHAPSGPSMHAAPSIDAQINALLSTIYGRAEGADGHLSLHLDSADVPAKVIADALTDVDEMAPGLRPVRSIQTAPSYQGALEREVAEEGEFAISVRGLEGALAAFSQPVPDPAAQALANALLRMLDTALLEDRFQVATGIVQGVRHSPQARSLIGDWMDDVVSESRFRHVAAAFNNPQAGEEARTAVLEYFKICGAWAVNPLLNLLPSIADAQLRRAVSNLLLEIGIVDISPLLEMLHNEQAFVAQEAVYLIAHLDNPDGTQAILQAARHPSPPVRHAVAEHAVRLPKELARNLISDLVLDSDPKVRALALRNLARFPGHSALLLAEGAVHKVALEGQSFEYKRAALESYAMLAQNKGVQLLHRYIRDGEGFLTGKDAEEIAVAAAGALAKIRTVAAVEILKRTSASRNKRLKETAKRALVFMKERA